MSEKERVLGICLAKMQDRVRTEYLNAINKAAAIEGWKTVAYNSFRDFRKNDRSLQGAKSIYKIINYDEIDVVIVFPESINNSSVSDSLIETAKASGKPVITVGTEREGCYSIVRDYEEAFRSMLNHVIKEHGARNTFFVSGFKDDDERSENRLKIYKEVLAENGITFDEKRMFYGNYKDEIIGGGMDRVLSGSDIPEAIICIDDKTAIAVCEKMSEYDLKSPNDIIVTGFGGIPAAYYYHPSITTCSDDVEKFAEIVIMAAKDAMENNEPKVYMDAFKTRIRRSCGCDMRSYISAGRRAYDLQAAKAAGIYVPESALNGQGDSAGTTIKGGAITGSTEIGGTSTGVNGLDNASTENTGLLDIDAPAETVFMPNAADNCTVILYKKAPEQDLGSDKQVTPDVTKEKPEKPKDDEPLFDEKALNEFAASNPKLADMKLGTYDITFGAGRQVEKDENGSDKDSENTENGNDESASGDNRDTQGADTEGTHITKIYSSDIFRSAGRDKAEYSTVITNTKADTLGAEDAGTEGSLKTSDNRNEDSRDETNESQNYGSGNNISKNNENEGNVNAADNDGYSSPSNAEIEKAAHHAMEVAEDKRCAGLHSEEKFRSGNHVAYIYKELDEIERREDSLLAWLDRMLEIPDLDDICSEISKRIPEGSALYLYSELLESNFDIETFEEKYIKNDTKDSKKHIRNLKLTKIKSAADPQSGSEEIPVSDIAKSYINGHNDRCMLVLNPVFIGDFVCGYYAVKTATVSEIRSNTKLLNMGLNMIFRFLANQNRQQRMLYNIENSVFVSSMTGLPNLKGSTRWFETFSGIAENHAKPLSISVFAMPRYTYIYENYGLNEVEDAVHSVVERIRNSCRKTSFLGQFAEGEYIVIDVENNYDDGSGVSYADEIFEYFSKQMEEFNRRSTKEYFLEVNFGTATVEEGWDSTLENLVRMAMSDMYLRRLREGKTAPVIKDKTFDREYFTTFELLVDRNLFRYHFQPIVDASTGNICAYEALMRTGGGISVAPLDVLEIAKNANRLYDIEKASVVNVMRIYEENLEKFGDRKVFINTIPGYFLNDADRTEFVEKFGKYLDSVVFEVTETNTVTDEELEKLRAPAPGGQKPSVAVDDYGTGHSNIVNLLRYAPQIIKIDHFLISNIQDDSNKQMFVKNTIEFARMNNIKVLAEGVETYEELKKAIEYGVDYIQGFYTAHPSQEIVEKLSDNIRNEILSESIKAAQYDSDNLTYNAKAGETVNLLDLALKKYTVVNVLGGKVKLVGEPDNVIDMVIRTEDDKKTDLLLENVNLRGVTETTVQLGKNTETALCIMGECTLNKDGIYVPLGSRLTVSGDGNLHIITSRNLSFGIGSNCNEPHGDISFDMTGSVKIVANGDKVVGIGGGRCDGSRIRLINGSFDISAKAIHAVAIGSDVGDTDIYIGRTAHCRLKSDGNDSVALGSISGRAEIVSRGKLDIIGDGEKTVGIGSISGYAKVDLLSNDFSIVLHSYCGIGLGSLTGNAELKLEDADVDIYAEGTQINGVGSGEEMASTDISGGNLKVEILAGIPRSFGAGKGDVILHYGSVTSMHDYNIVVRDEHLQRIQPKRIDSGVVFEK